MSEEIPPKNPVQNEEIDFAIIESLVKDKRLDPGGKATNLFFGSVLLNKFRDRLPRTDDKAWRKLSELHNACELANRACQRLRKASKIVFHPKTKWDFPK